jgi:hypothetical protein
VPRVNVPEKKYYYRYSCYENTTIRLKIVYKFRIWPFRITQGKAYVKRQDNESFAELASRAHFCAREKVRQLEHVRQGKIELGSAMRNEDYKCIAPIKGNVTKPQWKWSYDE